MESPKVIRAVGPGMAVSPLDEDIVYVVTTDVDGTYGFSLTRFGDEETIQLMVEDQTHCDVGPSEMVAKLYADKLTVTVSPNVVAGLDIPTSYVVEFSATPEVLHEMDVALKAICADVAEYSRMYRDEDAIESSE